MGVMYCALAQEFTKLAIIVKKGSEASQQCMCIPLNSLFAMYIEAKSCCYPALIGYY